MAAITPAAAEEAAALVKVQYDAMPFVVDRATAREADAPVVFPGPADEGGSAGGGGGPKNVPQTGNVHGPQRKQSGDVEKGFAEADVIVESEYFTEVQTHSALETHGFVVDWKPEEVTVYASTQDNSLSGIARIDAADSNALARAIKPGSTKLIWIETPANPTWDVTDIAAASTIDLRRLRCNLCRRACSRSRLSASVSCPTRA